MGDHRFKQGDDISHLLQCRIASEPDGDGDYYVEAAWADDDGEREMATYINKDRLDPRQKAYDDLAAIKAVTGGGIESIEQFLQEG